ncbi:MAG: hypothetical protein R3F59_31210, partial [Myxococcota bacterium]
LPVDDPGTVRTVGVLRVVDLAAAPEPDAEALLRDSLALCGPRIPPALLDWLLEPECAVPPDAVERACLAHDGSPATVLRIRLLRVRHAARICAAAPHDDAARNVLAGCVTATRGIDMHEDLRRWVERVAAARPPRPELLDALGPNLPLTDDRNAQLHASLRGCFAGLGLASARRLTRLTFSAWTSLRDLSNGTASFELASCSAQAASLRQVFEVLLQDRLLARFLHSPHGGVQHDLLASVRRGEATLGLGRWYGLLFGRHRRQDALATALRRWYAEDGRAARLRRGGLLRDGLAALLEVGLHALPHDEQAAQANAERVLEVVTRVGFDVAAPSAVPQKGAGLVGALCRVQP